MKGSIRGLWMGCLVGLCIFVNALQVNAVSFQGAEALRFKITPEDIGLEMLPSEPKVFIDVRGKTVPLVKKEVHADSEYISYEVQPNVKAGSYQLILKTGRELITLPDTLRVFSPIINNIEAGSGGIKEGKIVTLEGLFFGKAPEVRIRYEVTKEGKTREIARKCSIVRSRGEAAAMDKDSGDSKIRVEVPSLGGKTLKSVSFEVANGHGSGRILYNSGTVAASDWERGTLLGYSHHGSIKADDVWDYLLHSLQTDAFMRWLTEKVLWFTKLWYQKYHYDLELWNINYSTVDASGNPIMASGVVVVPQKVKAPYLLSFQHGTMLMKKEAPTLSDGAELGFAVTFAAVDGFVVSIPDHAGLGQAAYRNVDLYHPYCQAKPLAQGAADMMLAVKQFLNSQYPTVAINDKRSYLTGYSEGGYITLSLLREMETNTYELPPPYACAPLDGPHSLSKVMLDKMLDDKPFPVQYFAPYLLVSACNTYGLYKSPSDYLDFPYDISVAPLINGYFPGSFVDALMPVSGKPRDALLPDIMESLLAYKGPFYDALKKNDLVYNESSWVPKAHVNFYHGEEDDCVPYGNSEKAFDYYKKIKKADHVSLEKIEFPSLLPRIKPLHVLYAPFAFGEAWWWFHDKMLK